MRKKLLSFTVTEDMGGLDAAITAYVKEWILDIAVDVPEEERTMVRLSKIARCDREKMSRWINALGIREQLGEL